MAALRIAREIRPSVLVLDVNMPLMDGFEVLAAIRNEGATASIRVLMLTVVSRRTTSCARSD